MNGRADPAYVAARVAQVLNPPPRAGVSCAPDGPIWRVAGDAVLGPNRTAVLVDDRHGGGPGHLDLGFALDRYDLDGDVLWDCLTGEAPSPHEAVERGLHVWRATTGAALLELLTQRGEYADHYPPDDPQGLPPWHVVHGGISAWGAGDAPAALQRWWLADPPLPRLRASLWPALERPLLNGVKLFLGSGPAGPVAEVRVNDQPLPSASERLLGLGWPRAAGSAYVRSYALLVRVGG